MVLTSTPHTRLPFVEKYRPNGLEDLVSHTEIIMTLKKMVDERRVPHFLFYGPPGTGKTSTVLAMARRLFGAREYKAYVSEVSARALHFEPMRRVLGAKQQAALAYLQFNASDDRGIDVVRNNIIKFAETAAVDFDTRRADANTFKLVILDEADAMTKDAQNALKRVIEKYALNVRFCLICNHLSAIIPAIQSRCTRFRFPPLSKDQIMPRLNFVVEQEKLNVTPDGKQALYELSGGDMRKILNVLQSTSLAFDTINERTVYACVGQPDPRVIERILQILLKDNLNDAIQFISQLQCDNAISLSDILENMTDTIINLDFKKDENICAALVERLSDIQKRVKNGCSESLQLNALVSSFILARESVFV